jgi:hypothetical protein
VLLDWVTLLVGMAMADWESCAGRGTGWACCSYYTVYWEERRRIGGQGVE